MPTYIVRCLESSADLAIYGFIGFWAKKQEWNGRYLLLRGPKTAAEPSTCRVNKDESQEGFLGGELEIEVH